MYLHSLFLLDFKNHPHQTFQFNRKIVCFSGENGSGKTNLLDAIYLLCLTKSFSGLTDQQLIRHSAHSFVVEGTFSVGREQYVVKCYLARNQKKEFFLNHIKYERVSHHIGLLPAVMIGPEEQTLISGGSEVRRRFIDNTLSQLDRKYLENLQEYNRLIAHRNALLKQFAERQTIDTHLLQVYDQQLAPLSNQLYQARCHFINNLQPLLETIYKYLSADKESAGLQYQSDLHSSLPEVIFSENLSKDYVLRRTTGGIHCDDLIFTLNHVPVKKYGSQGQQKTFVLSLKLAQALLLEKHLEKPPLLLLDDLFDKLDAIRGNQLLHYLCTRYSGQIFITHTDKQKLEQAMSEWSDSVQYHELVRNSPSQTSNAPIC